MIMISYFYLLWISYHLYYIDKKYIVWHVTHKTIEDKMKRAKEIYKEIATLDEELRQLFTAEPQIELPMGFSWNDKVFEILKEAGNSGLDRKRILIALEKKYDRYGVDKSKIASSLAYLKNNKKQIEQISRGIYRIIGQ